MCLVLFFILELLLLYRWDAMPLFWAHSANLEDYIPLNEVLGPPPPVSLGNVWDYGRSQFEG
jgi:hypothetical protein